MKHTRLSLWLVLCTALILPMWAHAAPDGMKLFTQNCAACHGSHGTGGVGVPLALKDFLANVPDSYLFKTIRHGRPGRVMPAFSQLSDAEVKAIVGQIRSWGPKAPDIAMARIEGNAAHGKKLFAQYCAACHGDHGQGGAGTGVTFSRPRNLPIIAPALNNPGFLAAAPDQMIKRTLMKGRSGTPMVSFLDKGLKEKDIDDIVSYVRSFQSQPQPHTSAPLKADNPVLVYESSYDFDTTVDNVKRAAVGRNFKLIRLQTLDQGFVPPGHENKKQEIVYFCNFELINTALGIDPRVGLFMPCRITVVQDKNVVKVVSINPKYLSPLFNNSALNKLCNQMYQTYQDILEEATL